MGHSILFPRIDGQDATGYLAEPTGEADATAPAIVVIHEWWGIQDQIRGICDRYAAEGYRALAVDLYRGKVAANAAEAQNLMQSLDFLDATRQTVAGAARFLKQSSARVGLTGYCMGGVITILGAAHCAADFDAAACYYGLPPEDAYDPADISIPLLGHFATRDGFFTIDRVDALEAKLKAAGATFEFHRYEADHAFCNEKRPEVYDPEACRLANQRTAAFFREHLKS